ncbi:hypothetical protein NHQ30_010858 [Ciborinia camelliae]|nr:hypothetical protein NHQ30_010858 [Ciborinia camelliae]
MKIEQLMLELIAKNWAVSAHWRRRVSAMHRCHVTEGLKSDKLFTKLKKDVVNLLKGMEHMKEYWESSAKEIEVSDKDLKEVNKRKDEMLEKLEDIKKEGCH